MNKKRLMAAFLCLCLIGIGDVNNPYLIATGAQLAFLAQQVEEKVRTERTSGNDSGRSLFCVSLKKGTVWPVHAVPLYDLRFCPA